MSNSQVPLVFTHICSVEPGCHWGQKCMAAWAGGQNTWSTGNKRWSALKYLKIGHDPNRYDRLRTIPCEHLKTKYATSNPLKCYHLTEVTSQCIGASLLIYPPNTHFYQPFGSWQLLSSDLEWDDCGREKFCRNSGWAGALLLLSFLYRTWQYDNILSTILSDTRLWSSPIINPGWAPAQVVQERRPTDCQHVWQTPSIPQTWRWSCTGDTLTLSTAYTVDSAELQPTNPSVELIIRSLLKTQARPSALKLSSAGISKLPIFN